MSTRIESQLEKKMEHEMDCGFTRAGRAVILRGSAGAWLQNKSDRAIHLGHSI